LVAITLMVFAVFALQKALSRLFIVKRTPGDGRRSNGPTWGYWYGLAFTTYQGGDLGFS
jgi:hypothetical protein